MDSYCSVKSAGFLKLFRRKPKKNKKCSACTPEHDAQPASSTDDEGTKKKKLFRRHNVRKKAFVRNDSYKCLDEADDGDEEDNNNNGLSKRNKSSEVNLKQNNLYRDKVQHKQVLEHCAVKATAKFNCGGNNCICNNNSNGNSGVSAGTMLNNQSAKAMSSNINCFETNILAAGNNVLMAGNLAKLNRRRRHNIIITVEDVDERSFPNSGQGSTTTLLADDERTTRNSDTENSDCDFSTASEMDATNGASSSDETISSKYHSSDNVINGTICRTGENNCEIQDGTAAVHLLQSDESASTSPLSISPILALQFAIISFLANDSSKAKTEAGLPHGIVRSTSNHLDAILCQMRDASQKRKELEKEHAETLASLREKQNELQWRCSGIAEKAKLRENIESLQSKVRELEKKMELQNVHHEELLLEMASIKRSSLQRSNTFVATTASSYTTPNQLWKTTNVSSNQEVQTSPESYTAADKTYPPPNQRIITSSSSSGATVSFDPNIYTKHKQPLNTEIRQPPNISGCCGGIAPTSSYIDLHRASLDPSSHHYPISTSSSGSRYFDSTIKQHHLYTPVAKPSTATLVSVVPSSSIAVQTDSILVNKMNTEKPPCPDDKGCMMMMHPSQPHQHSNLAVEIDKIMAKISRDNKVLAELDRTHANTGVHGPISGHEITRHTDGSVVVGNSVHLAGTASQVNVAKPSSLVSYHQPTQTAFDIGTRTSYIPTHACQLPTISSNQQPYTVPSSYHFSFPPSSMPPTLPATSHYDVNSAYNALMSSSNRHENIPIGSYLNCREVMNRSTDSDLDRIHDMVEIPGKGLCYVYIAKYSYDPFSRSTGSCPEAELAVNAGDYLLVWGASEDEGYVDAELMDGRRGLVPINYIQRLSGEELSDFNQRVLAGMKEIDDCLSTVIPQDIECIPTEDYSKRYGLEYHLGDIMEEEEDDNDTAENVPAPKQLTLERQLNKSIVIRWNAPDNNNASHCIDSYHVYVDKMLKATVKATERTKALLEGVDSNKPHRISVRSVTHNRRTSRDAACTMLIGKDVPAYPTNVRATHVTATSAVISWLPSNSNYQHTVCVNNVEVRTVKPGVYRHTITGLVPNTTYRVTVRAKNIRAPQYDDKSSISDKFASHIDFHTLPKGLPDPPAEIQVEPGPQDGTLLVTWIPVTLNNSNGALITGYAVYADGKKVTEVDSPTGDHALIDISKIMSLNPKHVTVRTKSKENHSADSAPIPIPSSVMSRSRHAHQHSSKHVQKAVPRSGHQMPRHPPRNAYGQVIIEPEENLSDKEIYPGQNPDVPAIEITKDSNVEALYSGDDTLDSNGRGGRGMASYNQRMPMKSNIPPKSHAERGRPPPPQIIQQERGLSRMNYDMRDDKNMDMHRERRMMASDSQHHFSYDNESKGPHRSQSPDRKGRWVQALFDYDPTTMSPNPNACLEELPFLAGDFIKIYGDQDPDGFYWGECHGKRGFVPHNMISAVTTPKHLLEDIKKREKLDVYHDMITKKMVAMFDYDPKQNSPNTDTDVEINFKQGQIVTVYGEPDEDGFYIGEVDGVRGLVPSNYLQEVGELSTEDAINNYLYGGNARGTVAKHVPSQYDRGHGPGAKGPPPPPRDGLAPRDPRDKRKGSSNDQETTGERKTTTSSRSHNW